MVLSLLGDLKNGLRNSKSSKDDCSIFEEDFRVFQLVPSHGEDTFSLHRDTSLDYVYPPGFRLHLGLTLILLERCRVLTRESGMFERPCGRSVFRTVVSGAVP